MADIKLWGATFPDVPKVLLPTATDGTAEFYEVSGSQTVTDNGTYDVKSLAEMVVNVEGSGGGSTPSGSSANDVTFYDYDGTILYSYTADEFASLSALPENPTHSGLTSQGWNWSLADAQTYVAKYGKLNVGQMYITDDGKTRLYVHFEKGRTSPLLGVGVNGTVVVDWGDGSATDTLTGASLTAVQTVQHTYAPGDYVISLEVTSGNASIFGNNGSYLLRKANDTSNENRVYQNAIQRVEIGAQMGVGTYAFQSCHSLISVTIPNSVISIGSNTFNGCYSLISVTIPNSVTKIESNAFRYCYSLTSVTTPDSVTSIAGYSFNGCYSLTSVTIPDSVTSIRTYAFQSCHSLISVTISNSVTKIESNAFQYCYSLTSVTIPDSVTSIAGYSFNSCYGMAEYHLLPTTPPTLANTNAFASIPSDCIIYVPAESLEAYQTASNWSTYASKMQGE